MKFDDTGRTRNGERSRLALLGALGAAAATGGCGLDPGDELGARELEAEIQRRERAERERRQQTQQPTRVQPAAPAPDRQGGGGGGGGGGGSH